MQQNDRNFLASAETTEEPAIQPSKGTLNLRDTAICDFLNRGIGSGLFTLVVMAHKMHIPVRYLTPIENGWIECVIADALGSNDNDARVVVKNYSTFLLSFGQQKRDLL